MKAHYAELLRVLLIAESQVREARGQSEYQTVVEMWLPKSQVIERKGA